LETFSFFGRTNNTQGQLMRSFKILLIFGILFFSASFSATSIRAEDVEEISLRKAVEEALANNLNLQLRREDVNSAEGATLSAEGKFDIYLKTEANAQREERTPIVYGGPTQEDSGYWNSAVSKVFTPGTSMSLSWNNRAFNSDTAGQLLDPWYNSKFILELRQPLLKGFGTDVQTSSLRSTQKQLEAASYQVNSEAANLAAQVKVAYWNLVFALQDIEVQQLSLTLARKLLEETEAKIAAGRLAKIDIYQPQSEVTRREELLISAERAIGAAEDELKLLLNSDKWQTSFQPTDKPATEPIDLDPEAIQDNALKNRPDIKAADLLIKAAQLDKQRTQDDIRPDLSLVGSVGLAGTEGNYGDALDNSVSSPDNLWQVGIAFSVPLENRVAEGNYLQAKASYNRAKTSAELLRQETRRTVRTTVRDFYLALKAIDATRKTSLATLKRLEAEQAKFDSGRSTTFDVLAAQEAYARALSKQNLTNITYANILGELDRIQGLVTFSSSR
jgi:outer membrane protein